MPWRLAAAAVAGTVVGLFAHPDVPRNLQFLVVNLNEAIALRTGEFAPLSTRTIMVDGWLWIVAYLAAFRYARFSTKGDQGVRTWIAFLAATLMIVVTLRHMRGIDFLPPFVALFGALVLDERLEALRHRDRKAISPVTFRMAIAALAVGAVAFTSVQAVRGRAECARNTVSGPHKLEAAAAWLRSNTAPGELVVNPSAGDFEQLWLYNRHNTYFVGFNVNFLQRGSPQIYRVYARFQDTGDLAALQTLLETVPDARYMLASTRLPASILLAITQSPRFEVV